MQIPSDIRAYQARCPSYVGPRGPWLEHLVEDAGMSYEEAMETLSHYEALPVTRADGVHIGTILKRNKEVHFCFFREHRSHRNMTRDILDRHLLPVLKSNGFLVTKVASEEAEGERFVKKLGFEFLGSTIDGFKTFIMNKIRYPGQKHAHI